MTWEQQAYRQIDFVGSFTAAAGCAIYDGGAWPAKYRTTISAPSRRSTSSTTLLSTSGVGFTGTREPGREETEFIRSKDMWFRPIEVRVGPDGALYVLDFYNQAVIHNDTRGPAHNKVNAAVRPDRDHYFGRIWRIDHKEVPRLPVPDLSKATDTELTAALQSPNRPVRFTAQRLLSERVSDKAAAETDQQLREFSAKAGSPVTARAQALWTLQARGTLDDASVEAALQPAENVALAQLALKILALNPALAAKHVSQIAGYMSSKDPAVLLAAINALGSSGDAKAASAAIVAHIPELDNLYLQSAALATASRSPVAFLEATLGLGGSSPPPALTAFAAQLTDLLNRQPDEAAQVVILLAARPPTAMSHAILSRLAQAARAEGAPTWSEPLQGALRTLLNRSESEAASAMPLVIAWDRSGTLVGEVKALLPKFVARLSAGSEDEAALETLVSNLIAARALDPKILPAIGNLLGSKASSAVQQQAIEALGDTSETASAEILLAQYGKLSPTLQGAAFAQLLKRRPWSLALVNAIKSGAVPLESLGVIALDKLRHHPDREMAALANETIDQIRGPMTQKKDQVIAALLPAVDRGGDAAKGKALFNTVCTACHHFNGVGTNLAPDLTGMGAHPRAELLTDIIDPNREVDPTFAAYDFQTKRGEAFQGIIVSENAKTVRVRDAAGEHELAKGDLASRRSSAGPSCRKDLRRWVRKRCATSLRTSRKAMRASA